VSIGDLIAESASGLVAEKPRDRILWAAVPRKNYVNMITTLLDRVDGKTTRFATLCPGARTNAAADLRVVRLGKRAEASEPIAGVFDHDL
jgi:hypothetical protein